MHINITGYMLYTCILSHVIFHHGLSQGINYCSMCGTVGPIVCLSCTWQFGPMSPTLPVLPSPPLWQPKSVLYVPESVS